MTYKEIEIKTPKMPKDVVEVELEDIIEEHEEENLEMDLGSGERKKVFKPSESRKQETRFTFAEDDDVIDEPQEEDETPVVTKKPVTHDKKPSRSNKRIRELAAEKNALMQELEAERVEKENLRKQLQAGTKVSGENLKQNLGTQVEMLAKQLTEAMQSGDAEGAVKVQMQLMETKDKMSKLEDQLKGIEDEPEQERRPQRQPQVSRKAMAWVGEHPEFKADPVFYGAAMAVNSQLINEGFDAESDEFYEELDARLAPRFPEVFGVDDENDVEYNSQEESVPTSKPSKDVKKPVKQTVSGASRTPSSSFSKARKSNTVTLTPDDVAQAENWGWSLERMARRKLHIEKHRREDGYVPIMIPNE
jgi:hypothetical protein